MNLLAITPIHHPAARYGRPDMLPLLLAAALLLMVLGNLAYLCRTSG